MTNFDHALALFLSYANSLQSSSYVHEKSFTPGCKITFQFGKKYVKVIANGTNGSTARSVFCFIDIATGDVLKAASWKAPATGCRGNIFTPCAYGISKYGALYC